MRHELVFTAYNRPQYFYDSIGSWNLCRNLPKWNTAVFIEPSELQTDMGSIAMQLNTNVTIHLNNTLQGVLVNPWNAINTAFTNGADFVVLAEDDVIVSNDTLEFFEWAALEYQTGHDVLAINAFSRLGTGKANQLTLTDPSFSPLVWGVWKDRWENILRDTWDKDYSTGNPDGSEAGWDWNINRIIAANSYHIVKPLHSRSNHIGEHQGTHMTPDLFPTSQAVSFKMTRGRQRYTEV